ncbi:hypothetical protein EDD11_000604 [Mortierella claussenii]|nr:hypothetical protein EDD11_000604 [Mortierella claussenii]
MSPSSRVRSHSILSRLLLVACLVLLLSSAVLAQSPSPQPSPEVTTPQPSPTPDPTTVAPSPTPDVPSASPSQTDISPTATVIVPVPTSAPTPTTPDPIFSSSASCVACKSEFPNIRNCSTRLPIAGNLTMINQVLPFYQCICPGNQIETLQQCSICLRSTGQQAFLNRAFYNVTNQDIKAMHQVCTETADGSKVPSSSTGAWHLLLSSVGWSVLSGVMLLLLPLGGAL